MFLIVIIKAKSGYVYRECEASMLQVNLVTGSAARVTVKTLSVTFRLYF